MKINELLSDYFCDSHKIKYDEPYKIEWVNPESLLTSRRIDIIAKLEYLNSIESGLESPFLKELYVSHIEAFSLGTFKEPGNKKKSSAEDYINVFRELYFEIKENGFDSNISAVPVGKGNIILNGSHRTAIALKLNLKIPIIRFEDIIVDYGFDFFSNRKLKQKYLNYLITRYLEYRKDIFVGCVWPIANDDQEILDMTLNELNLKNNIVHKFNINLNRQQLRNLIYETYNHQEWLGNFRNRYSGAESKTIQTYKKGNMVTFFTLEAITIDEISHFKREFRKKFSFDKHSIYISDNFQESLILSRIIYNQNTIDFLSLSRFEKYENVVSLVKSLKNNIVISKIDPKEVLVTSSIILGLLGLRKPKDIDFFYLGTKKINFSETRNAYKHYLVKNLREIADNPCEHFYFMGLKFISIKNLIEFKSNRNEKKDILDIKLLKSIYEEKKFFKLVHKKILEINKYIYYLRLRLKGLLFVITIYLLKKLKLYSIFKRFYFSIFK